VLSHLSAFCNWISFQHKADLTGQFSGGILGASQKAKNESLDQSDSANSSIQNISKTTYLTNMPATHHFGLVDT